MTAPEALPHTRPDLDFEVCYRAVQSRDERFDGRFATCVTSTDIYCRPSCPALTPKRANVRFLPTAAAAQLAGFRACLRCRPDAVPGDPQWSYRTDVAGRAMRLITDGVVDREGVSGLASRIGYTPRHLGRLLVAEVGAGPLALARAQRAHTARLLIETTTLGLAEIAFAAGFGSVRQFNDTMRQTYGRTPSQLRTARRTGHRDPAESAISGNPVAQAGPADTAYPADQADAAFPADQADAAFPAAGLGVITLRLPYREPLHAASMLEFLAARTIPGVDEVAGDRYRRGLRLPHGSGAVELAFRPGHVAARLHLADPRDLAPAVARCRRLLDLDADPVAVDALLALDPALQPSVATKPGVRVPGAVDGFEIAVRAVVGQQISVAGARSVLARLVATVNGEIPDKPSATRTGHAADEVSAARTGHAADKVSAARTGHAADKVSAARTGRGFPGAAEVADAPDEAFAMPASRRRTIRALAREVADGRLDLDPGADREEVRRRLLEIPGIGAWTAQYISLRALGDPDVLMSTDLGVRRGAAAVGLPDDPAELARHATQRWAPWRSYATVRLWRQLTTKRGNR